MFLKTIDFQSLLEYADADWDAPTSSYLGPFKILTLRPDSWVRRNVEVSHPIAASARGRVRRQEFRF